MGEIKGEFTGTWIPAHIMLDESLSCSGKILYATIASFNECFMLNKRLAELVGTSERTVQRLLKELKAKNYVQETSKKGQNRVLFAVRDLTEKPRQIVTPPTTNCHPYNKYNNKSNTTNISSTDSAKSDDLALLFNELREIFGVTERFKFSEKRRRQLKTRLKEFTREEILAGAKELSLSDFHTGGNPNGTVFAEPEWYTKSYERVEQWVLRSGKGEPDPENRGKLKVDKESINWDEV